MSFINFKNCIFWQDNLNTHKHCIELEQFMNFFLIWTKQWIYQRLFKEAFQFMEQMSALMKTSLTILMTYDEYKLIPIVKKKKTYHRKFMCGEVFQFNNIFVFVVFVVVLAGFPVLPLVSSSVGGSLQRCVQHFLLLSLFIYGSRVFW